MKAADPDIDNDERLYALCKALGNPVRLQIVRYIGRHPGCIGNQILLNLPGDAHRAQSTLSQHLKILCGAGLVEAEPDGPATTYSLSCDCLVWLREQIGELQL
jgi:DNA-binding transcriptional ArsR family regulator